MFLNHGLEILGFDWLIEIDSPCCRLHPVGLFHLCYNRTTLVQERFGKKAAIL